MPAMRRYSRSVTGPQAARIASTSASSIRRISDAGVSHRSRTYTAADSRCLRSLPGLAKSVPPSMSARSSGSSGRNTIAWVMQCGSSSATSCQWYIGSWRKWSRTIMNRPSGSGYGPMSLSPDRLSKSTRNPSISVDALNAVNSSRRSGSSGDVCSAANRSSIGARWPRIDVNIAPSPHTPLYRRRMSWRINRTSSGRETVPSTPSRPRIARPSSGANPAHQTCSRLTLLPGSRRAVAPTSTRPSIPTASRIRR